MAVVKFLVTFGSALMAFMFLSEQPLAASPSQEPHRQSQSITFEQRCEATLPPSRVTVTVVPGQVKYDFSRSIGDLIKAGGGLPGSAVLGLTEAALGTRFTFGMETVTDPESGKSCMRPQLAIELSAGVQTVSVAREFEKDSCSFHEILKHELLHVQANEAHAREAARQLETEITQQLGNRVFYGDRESLESELDTAVRERWAVAARHKLGKVQTQHAHIDRVEENTRVLRSCNGEVLRVVKQHGEMKLANVR